MKSAPVANFVQGPGSFDSFEQLLERTVSHNPHRAVSSPRRGLMHNARPRDDSRWVSRYDRLRPPGDRLDFRYLWDDLERIQVPVLLAIGADSGVVAADDVEEFLQCRPATRVEHIADACRSIQGDQPVRLAELIAGFVDQGPPIDG